MGDRSAIVVLLIWSIVGGLEDTKKRQVIFSLGRHAPRDRIPG